MEEEQDRDILWQAFLEFMRQGSNPDLTLEDLQRAAMDELQKSQESSNGMEQTAHTDEEPSSKRIKLMGEPHQQSSELGVDLSPSLELPKNQVVSLEAVDIESKAFLQVLQQKDVPPDILAAWMIRCLNRCHPNSQIRLPRICWVSILPWNSISVGKVYPVPFCSRCVMLCGP